MLSHTMTIAGLKRSLPICKVNDDLYIGAFVIFGDVELTVACAAELLKRAPAYDYIITAESKGIPLAYEMGAPNWAEQVVPGPQGREAVHAQRVLRGGQVHHHRGDPAPVFGR